MSIVNILNTLKKASIAEGLNLNDIENIIDSHLNKFREDNISRHNVLDKYNIVDGFDRAYFYSGILVYSTMEYIGFDAVYRLFKITDALYYCSSIHELYSNFCVYKSAELTEDEVLKILCDNTKSSQIGYYHSVSGGSYFNKLKTIENNNEHYTHESIAEKIKSKINIHKNIHFNLLLHGKPGTGKSSYIEYLARMLDRDVYIMPDITTPRFKVAVESSSTYESKIFLIPEIDKSLSPSGELSSSETEILEFLNGCFTPKNAVIIMTCNDIRKFKANPVLSRPGRLHFELEFGNITATHIETIVKKYYPEHTNMTIFDKFVSAITVSEFSSAIESYFILDKPLDDTFEVTLISKQKDLGIYY